MFQSGGGEGFGLAAFPALGLAVVSSRMSSTLFLHRLDDGARVGSFDIGRPRVDMSGDYRSGTLYGGLCATDCNTLMVAWMTEVVVRG